MKTKKTVKKKTTKKAATNKNSTTAKKADKKTRLQSVKRKTKKMVDDFLIKVNPQVQKQVDHLRATLEKTPTSVADLKLLGLKVLERAKNLSQTLRAEASTKKRMKK